MTPLSPYQITHLNPVSIQELMKKYIPENLFKTLCFSKQLLLLAVYNSHLKKVFTAIGNLYINSQGEGTIHHQIYKVSVFKMNIKITDCQFHNFMFKLM